MLKKKSEFEKFKEQMESFLYSDPNRPDSVRFEPIINSCHCGTCSCNFTMSDAELSALGITRLTDTRPYNVGGSG